MAMPPMPHRATSIARSLRHALAFWLPITLLLVVLPTIAPLTLLATFTSPVAPVAITSSDTPDIFYISNNGPHGVAPGIETSFFLFFNDPGPWVTMQQMELGFPFKALRSTTALEFETGADAQHAWFASISLQQRGSHWPALESRLASSPFTMLRSTSVLWSGLAANLLIASMIAAFLTFLRIDLSTARLDHRRRRGQCLACAHTLDPRASRCPECGASREGPASGPVSAKSQI